MIEPRAKAAVEPPVLSMVGVIDESEDSRGYDVSLRPGDLIVYASPRERDFPDVVGIATGLAEVPGGIVRYRGIPWRDLPAAKAAAARRRIGQCFYRVEKPGYSEHWIHSLDVWENLILAASFGGCRSWRSAKRALEALLEEIEFETDLSARPQDLTFIESLRLQWLRALLADPLEVLLVEMPFRRLPTDLLGSSLKVVNCARERGAAVLWYTSPLTKEILEALDKTDYLCDEIDINLPSY